MSGDEGGETVPSDYDDTQNSPSQDTSQIVEGGAADLFASDDDDDDTQPRRRSVSDSDADDNTADKLSDAEHAPSDGEQAAPVIDSEEDDITIRIPKKKSSGASRSPSPRRSQSRSRSRSRSRSGSPRNADDNDRPDSPRDTSNALFASDDANDSDNMHIPKKRKKGDRDDGDAHGKKRRLKKDKKGKRKDNQPKTTDRDAEHVGDDGPKRSPSPEKVLSHFDQVMADERSKKRHVTVNEEAVDSLVAMMVDDMAMAAQNDRECVVRGELAMNKLLKLNDVIEELSIKSAGKKNDHAMSRQENYIDNGVLIAMKAWLDPLPNKKLPHEKIRRELLAILKDMHLENQRENLKSSGIGKAVMFLSKHPHETAKNKQLCNELINTWSRQIAGLSTDYRNLNKETRREMLLQEKAQLEERKRIAAASGRKIVVRKTLNQPVATIVNNDLDEAMSNNEKKLRPGDKGWRRHATVPKPVQRDYLISPSSRIVHEESSAAPIKKGSSRASQIVKKQKDKKNKMGSLHHMSIEGRGLN